MVSDACATASTGSTAAGSRSDQPSRPPAHIDLPDAQQSLKKELSSEDDSGPEDAGDSDEATGLVGVSIGRTQSHLVNSKTPAVEKATALQEGGDYFAPLEDLSESPEITPDTSTDVRAQNEGHANLPVVATCRLSSKYQSHGASDAVRISEDSRPATSSIPLPSPWIAGPKKFRFADDDNAGAARDRSGSDPSRVQLPFGLPSIPNPIDMWNNFRILDIGSRPRSQTLADRRMNRQSDIFTSIRRGQMDEADESAHSNHDITRELLDRGSESTLVTDGQSTGRDARKFDVTHIISPKITRRRSEESMSLHRAISTASSLGDDSRFENISEMVNSRMKAIKDSFGDTRLPRPSLPTIPKFDSLKLLGARTDLDERSRKRSSNLDIACSRTQVMIGSNASQASRFINEKVPGPSVNRLKPNSSIISAAEAALHPHFTKAFSRLTGDLVILGGYRGSILREAQEPHRRLWITTKAGLNVRKVDLEVGLEDEDEERMPETIYASGMLTHIGPVDISKRLFKRLRSCENVQNGSLRIHEYAYDWRLSPHRLSRQLLSFIEKLPSNQIGVGPADRGAFVIAHSLGGLITRHAVNQRPELFSGVVFAGSPHRCINILGPIRKGDDVLLSSKVLTAQVNFTIRTSFALLPLDGYGFIDKETKEEYPVDFFDVNQWIEYRWSPCVGTVLPALVPQKTGLASMIATASAALPLQDLPFLSRKRVDSRAGSGASAVSDVQQKAATTVKTAAAAVKGDSDITDTSMAPQLSESSQSKATSNGTPGPATDDKITIPREAAIKYLTRTLAEVKKFKQELSHKPEFTEKNLYPSFGVIYGKSEPTVYAARVSGRDGIKRADAYDSLAFASGDGVVLAKAAMLPEGYRAARGGVIATEKGHVSLLGDLEAVGKAVNAVLHARRRGVGLGAVEKGP